MRLSAASRPAGVQLPGYDPAAHGVGIVHIGLGAFHKAHQAVYTDVALAARGGDWRINGVSLRSGEAAQALNPQDGRYVVLTRDGVHGDTARLIASLDRVLVAPDDPGAMIAALAAPATRIVTLTVTEKAYGIDPRTGGLDPAHPAVARDLVGDGPPIGVIGYLVAGLAARRAAGQGGLTILSCDNLAGNGAVTRRLVTQFAARRDPALASWIDGAVRFPSSMVDRITPASTPRTLADVQALTGLHDAAAVEAEPFSQWVIEDDFAAGRPAWEEAGALLVADVAPFEQMKLRLLNGAHSLLAYAGVVAGHATVAEAVADPGLRTITRRQMDAAGRTLPPVPGVAPAAYADSLLTRFANPAIAHQTRQIAMDGTQKLPPRILAPMAAADRPAAFGFAIAAWMRYCLARTDAGAPYPLHDPAEDRIAAAVAGAGGDPARIFAGLWPLLGGQPPRPGLDGAVIDMLGHMLDHGMAAAIAHHARSAQ